MRKLQGHKDLKEPQDGDHVQLFFHSRTVWRMKIDVSSTFTLQRFLSKQVIKVETIHPSHLLEVEHFQTIIMFVFLHLI